MRSQTTSDSSATSAPRHVSFPCLPGAAFSKTVLVVCTFWLALGADLVESSTLPRGRRTRPRVLKRYYHRNTAPRYERAAPAPASTGDRLGEQEVARILSEQRAGSPIEMAVEGITGSSPCGDTAASSAMNALISRMNALANETITIASRAVATSVACAHDNCGQYNADLARLGQIQVEIVQLASQLQGMVPQSSGGDCGGATVLATPPSQDMDAVAEKFGFSFADGGGAPGMQGGAYFRELAELAREVAGGGTDEDAWLAAARRFDGINMNAGLLEDAREAARLQRETELKRATAGDATAAHRADYLRINYEELGDKYKDLVTERGRQAEEVSREALSEPSPLADAHEMPVMREPLISEELLSQAGGKAEEILRDKGKETLLGGIMDGIKAVLPGQRGEALADSVDFQTGIIDGVNKLFGSQEFFLAIREMASGSTSTVHVDKFLESIGAFSNDTSESAGELRKKYGGWF